MATEQPYDYPGAPIEITGADKISVELAYKSDDVELTFDVDDPSWADRNATRETHLRISREDWWALVAYVAAEHARVDRVTLAENRIAQRALENYRESVVRDTKARCIREIVEALRERVLMRAAADFIEKGDTDA